MLKCARMYTRLEPQGGSQPIPTGKRPIFGWPVFSLSRGEPITAVAATTGSAFSAGSVERPPGSEGADAAGSCSLQLVVGVDIREETTVVVSIPADGSSRTIGEFDIRYGYTLQPFRLELSARDAEAIFDYGVQLELTKGDGPLHFLLGAGSGAWSGPVPQDALASLTLVAADHPATPTGSGMQQVICARDSLARLVRSTAGVQPFGWMDGAVLDGAWCLLQAEEAAEVTRKHLRLFTGKDGSLSYEDARSRPRAGEYAGIEYTLPVAAFARLDPRLPAVDAAVDFWLARADADGLITDEEFVSAEGCYTVGYPLAVVGSARRDRRLLQLSQAQFLLRWKLLHTEQTLQLRAHSRPIEVYRGWARAYAWFMLGLAHAMPFLEEFSSSSDMCSMLETLTQRTIETRCNATGLWSCFIDESELPVDTSGSAGIAAAMALAYRAGILGEAASESAAAAGQSLCRHISQDGLLGGVAQSNRGGEALQRSSYRVFSQMGSGLAAQLFGSAALEVSH